MQVNKIGANIKFSFINYIIVNALKFMVRMVFVRTLSIEYLGINGLFTNILAMLSLAELGVAPAIVYSMYKPLAVGDKETVKSIMQLFKRVYITIGVVILAAGLCVYPWLDSFIKDKPDIPELHYFYLVFLLNTGVSYFWSYQRNLLIADQKQYYVNIYQAAAQTIVGILQIIFLLIITSYWSFVILMLLGTVLENVTIANKAKKEYPYLKEAAGTLDKSIKGQIIRNTKAMVIHKIGGAVVFSTSNIILSKFVGLTAVGLYSNYYMVIGAMNAFASKFFEAITASIGNMMVVDSKEQQQRAFHIIELLTAFQAALISVGLYVMFNPFIELWLGKAYLFDSITVLFIVVSFYFIYMRKAVLMYKDACGLFWNDRYKPIAESIINLVASIYLAIHYGVIGVVCGGIISTLATCLWVEPYILFRYGLNLKLKDYFINYFKFTTATLICAVVSKVAYGYLFIQGNIVNFVAGMVLCVADTTVIWLLLFKNREEMQYIIRVVKSKIKRAA